MNITDQLRRDEGYRSKPYFDCCSKPFRQCTCDPQGKLTIGIGRNLEDTDLTLAEAEYLLDNDIARSSAAVLTHLPWTARIDEIRRWALVNMAFNLGIKGLKTFARALAAMEAGEWHRAAPEMLDSKWHAQTGIRAERLAEQIRTGEWQ